MSFKSTLAVGLVSAIAVLAAILPADAQTAGARKQVKVAAVDFVPAWGDLDGNVSRLAKAAEEVAKQGVEYAVFPETAVSGYLFSGPQQLAPFVDTIPGKATAALLPILQRTGLHMSVGIAERDAATGLVYNTAVLMGPNGIIGKYRKNGLNPQDQKVFAPGTTGVEVFDTPLGRVGLALAEELRVPELGGLYGALRTDILAAPAGRPEPLKVQVDAKLFAVSNPPTGRADFFPYASAKQNQLWLVSGGRRAGEATAAAIYGPEPIVETPTLTAKAGEDAVRYRTRVPAPGTWINQQQLITGQQSLYFIPIVMKDDSECVKEWRTKGTGPLACR